MRNWPNTSRGIFLARNISREKYSSREIFLARYWANSSYFPHEERISTYRIIVIWVFLWELALVGIHSISSYFPHEFIMRNFMRISRTGSNEHVWVPFISGTGGRFKNAYELLNLRSLKISMLYKNHIFQCMGKDISFTWENQRALRFKSS